MSHPQTLCPERLEPHGVDAEHIKAERGGHACDQHVGIRKPCSIGMIRTLSHLPRVDGESLPVPSWSAISNLRERFSTQALRPYWVFCRANESSDATCAGKTPQHNGSTTC